MFFYNLPGDEIPIETTEVVTAPVPDEVISQSVMEVTVETSSVVMTTEPEIEVCVFSLKQTVSNLVYEI